MYGRTARRSQNNLLCRKGERKRLAAPSEGDGPKRRRSPLGSIGGANAIGQATCPPDHCSNTQGQDHDDALPPRGAVEDHWASSIRSQVMRADAHTGREQYCRDDPRHRLTPVCTHRSQPNETGLVGIGLGELYRRLWSRPFDWRRFWRNAAIGLPLWVLVVWAIRTNH